MGLRVYGLPGPSVWRAGALAAICAAALAAVAYRARRKAALRGMPEEEAAAEARAVAVGILEQWLEGARPAPATRNSKEGDAAPQDSGV